MASRILIAENDSGAREQLASWLQNAGFACTGTDTGEALAAARQHPPDVALVGVAVPEDGGMWIVRSLRGQAMPPGVVVIALHEHRIARARVEGAAAQCANAIHK